MCNNYQSPDPNGPRGILGFIMSRTNPNGVTGGGGTQGVIGPSPSYAQPRKVPG